MNGQLIDTKKLVEALLSDLRLLSQEAKKKQNHVKEAAESGVVRIRNISTASPNEQVLISNLRAACSELLHPLVLGCATRVTKLVQISLQGIQRLVQHRILSSNGATIVTNELWGLVEQECEELRVLQTVLPLVSSELVVTGSTLAKCIVMSFRLHHAKDPVVINAASASIRQLVSTVFERVIQEDGIFANELQVIAPTGRVSGHAPPPTLRPCAADAFMLFRDLCFFINGKPPTWLVGIREMTRTLGLELLESVLKGYPSVFIRHSEFGQLLKEDVCPLIIRLFSPSLKAVNVTSQHPSSRQQYPSTTSHTQQQSFPITMRLVRIVTLLLQFYQNILHTECEIFISTLLRFVEGDRRSWQRPLALEALHRVVSSAELVRWMTDTFDCQTNSTNVLEKVASGLSSVVQQSLTAACISSSDQESDNDRQQEDGGPGFYVTKNLWIPYVEHITSKKSILLDSLDRMDPATLPEGYILSRSCVALCDLTQAIYTTIDGFAQQQQENDASATSQVAHVAYANAQPAILSAVTALLAASTDEVVTDQLLCCLSTLISAGCCLVATSRRRGGDDTGATTTSRALANAVYTLACTSMPSPVYLRDMAAIREPSRDDDADDGGDATKNKSSLFEMEAWPSTAQVVASGPPCPCPCVATELWSRQVLLTSKNMQSARTFLGVVTTHMQDLNDLWYMCLTTCQHLTWLLAMRPAQNGIFERGEGAAALRENGENAATVAVMVTTAAMADIGVLSSLIDKLAPTISQLDDASFCCVVDAVIRLSDESLAVAATGRDSSQFPLALLYRTCFLSLSRLAQFWSRTSAHFIKVCNHTSATMRDWAAVALTSLAKHAIKAKTTTMDVKTQQEACVASILALCQCPHFQVRRRQLDCVMSLMQTDGAMLLDSIWPNIIHIISAIIDNETGCELSLIRQGFSGLKLVSSDFLQNVPFENLALLIESISKYAKQHTDQNISLSALALLWTISDFVYRTARRGGGESSRDSTWMVLYTCLAESCCDQRFAVRKSACQTLLQIVTAHGHALCSESWHRLVWHILIPLLDKVRANLKSASTEKIGESSSATSPSQQPIIMHHSRDTEHKQWIETCILTLAAITKIFNSQRANLTQLADFGAVWEAFLGYLEWAGCYENAELSLAAIRAYQEVLLGKVSMQTLNVNMHQGSCDSIYDIQPPDLPQAQWVEAWKTWLRISRGLARQGCSALSTSMSSSMIVGQPMSSRTSVSSLASLTTPPSYIPGPSHLTAILHVFPPLFNRVAKSIAIDDLKYESLPAVLESMMNVPIPSEQAPFVLPSASTHLTPTQEALVEAVKNVYVECTLTGNHLRSAVPDLIRLLLRFASLATQRHATTRVAPGGQKSYRDYALTTIVPFAEYSLRMAVEFYVSTCGGDSSDVASQKVAVEIVRFVAEPLHLKYTCLSSTTWKLAATSLMTCLRTAIPLARQNAGEFAELWPAICDTMEKWLFTPNRSTRLAADERKRDELLECQAIEIIRSEMLAYATCLPVGDVQRVIALLHRGSISQIDANDVLGLDTHSQRNELAKACFDALLMSTSSSSPANVGGDDATDGAATSSSANATGILGNVAVASLMQRCTQVMNDFCRDFSSSGDLRLPRARTLEIVSALQAIDQLIDRLARDPRLSELYSQLVSLFPNVVDIVPCGHCDAELERQLVKTIKSYQTLFLVQKIP